MDFFTVKNKLMNIISNADSTLTPSGQNSTIPHVLGNWHVQAWQLTSDKFPIVTVRLQGKNVPIWGFKPPTVQFGELYQYPFTAYVWATTITESRRVADCIIDILSQQNKYPDVKIVDIINITMHEGVQKRRYPKALWRIIITGDLICEEPLQ